MITLLILFITVFFVYQLSLLNRRLKVLKIFNNDGAQTLNIFIIGEICKKQQRSMTYLVSGNFQKFFICRFSMAGSTFFANMPLDSQYEIGKEYLIKAWYLPESNLLLPDTNKNYDLKMHKIGIPYLCPKIVIFPRP